MARRWLGVLAVVAALVVVVSAAAVVISGRGDKPSPETPGPASVQQAQQTGDDADMMRRLQRKKLVEGSR